MLDHQHYKYPKAKSARVKVTSIVRNCEFLPLLITDLLYLEFMSSQFPSIFHFLLILRRPVCIPTVHEQSFIYVKMLSRPCSLFSSG